MIQANSDPPWPSFHILKHGPNESHLSGLYCLASCARWLHRLDSPKAPTIPTIIKAMKAVVPAPLPRDGLIEKHLRKAADLYDLHLYRPNIDGLEKPDWPADWLWIAAVQGLPLLRLRKPPPKRRYVVVLGLPDDQARFLVADPHPETPDKYTVPIEKFGPAWQAGATKTHRPWAVVVTSDW